MKQILIVGLGGFIGTVARYLVSKLNTSLNFMNLPVGTLLVNLLGSLLIGFIAGLFLRKSFADDNLRLFLMVGVCGGFTTFSTFSHEHLLFLQDGKILTALIYMFGSLILGVLAVLLGYILADLI